MPKGIFIGEWLYRSLLNDPELVDDFNKVKFGEGRLLLDEPATGFLSGTFDFGDHYALKVTGFHDGPEIRLRSIGIANTPTAGWVYEHSGSLAYTWPHADSQRPAIVGSVIRTAPHDGRPAGVVGSFIAVSRDRPVGNNIEALPDSVRRVLAEPEMRLHHTAWHATRNAWGRLNEATRKAVAALDWSPPRQALEYNELGQRKRTNTWTGAGEDFLFMHRQMIARFLDAMKKAGVKWQHWATIPSPGSGPTVPPVWDNGDPEDTARFSALKTDVFYWSRMRWWDERYKDPVYLRTLTLGELGAQMEWSVHNDMHMRWSGLPRDPETNAPIPTGRDADDFSDKWNLLNSDDLADFYASHVNPIFYKLHGWIDERIDDWFQAHEQVDPGSITPQELDGVAWFKKGKWVQVDDPWAGPISHHGGHDIEKMKKVIGLIVHPIEAVGIAGTLGRIRNPARVHSW